MVKVDLDRVRIVHSELGDKIYIGTVNKKDLHLLNNKEDRTNDFIKVLVSWCGVGFERIIVNNAGKEFSIQVREVKEK